jgi:hypothetical protein
LGEGNLNLSEDDSNLGEGLEEGDLHEVDSNQANDAEVEEK